MSDSPAGTSDSRGADVGLARRGAGPAAGWAVSGAAAAEVRWAPAVGLVVLAWLGAAGAAAWAVGLAAAGSDPAGLLLAAVAAAGLLVAAVHGTRARPRLRVDPGGLTVGGLLRERHHPWPFVTDVRVLRVRRLGRETSLLQIDAVDAAGAEHLLLFGRLDLAADPEDVAAVLEARRP
jgi:hypothetical protein